MDEIQQINARIMHRMFQIHVILRQGPLITHHQAAIAAQLITDASKDMDLVRQLIDNLQANSCLSYAPAA